MLINVGEIDVEIFPEQIAQEWWDMGSNNHVNFFNWIGDNVSLEHLSMQLQYVTDHPMLTDKARRIMDKIGEYSSQHQEKLQEHVWHCRKCNEPIRAPQPYDMICNDCHADERRKTELG